MRSFARKRTYTFVLAHSLTHNTQRINKRTHTHTNTYYYHNIYLILVYKFKAMFLMTFRVCKSYSYFAMFRVIVF